MGVPGVLGFAYNHLQGLVFYFPRFFYELFMCELLKHTRITFKSLSLSSLPLLLLSVVCSLARLSLMSKRSLTAVNPAKMESLTGITIKMPFIMFQPESSLSDTRTGLITACPSTPIMSSHKPLPSFFTVTFLLCFVVQNVRLVIFSWRTCVWSHFVCVHVVRQELRQQLA